MQEDPEIQEPESKVNLSNEQQKILHSKRIKYDISPYEIGIIKAMRKIQFGQLTIHFLQGVPVRYTIGASINVNPLADPEAVRGAGILEK